MKLVWTREEEFTWAYLRPAGLMELKATVAPDGTITTWEHHNYNSGDAGLAYAVITCWAPVTAESRVEVALAPRLVPRPRFHREPLARESFMDELAHTVEDGLRSRSA